MIAVLAKGCDKAAIIPERSLLLAAEAFEHFGSAPSQIGQNRARVMKFIRRRDQARRRIRLFEMGDVGFLPFSPWRLWRLIGIGTTIHDFGNGIAELFPDLDQPFRAPTIFHDIVQERADGFRFVAAVLERDRGHAENMCDIWDSGLLPCLITMRSRC